MSNQADERVFDLLEQAVDKAQKSLEKTSYFQPFLMLLNDADEIEVFQNDIEDSIASYAALEEIVKIRMHKNDIDVMVLAVDTLIPANFVKDGINGIRLHLEEKNQVFKKIGARFIYIPYELCKVGDADIFVKLKTPIPVGFPAEYIIK